MQRAMLTGAEGPVGAARRGDSNKGTRSDAPAAWRKSRRLLRGTMSVLLDLGEPPCSWMGGVPANLRSLAGANPDVNRRASAPAPRFHLPPRSATAPDVGDWYWTTRG